MAATAGFDVGPTADRNRRRKLSVLVAGRSVDWLLRRSKVEASRRQQPGHSDPRRCPRRARRRMAGRRHDSVRAERQPVRCFECRRPVASQPSPHSSRPDRTIIERRSSFRTGNTFSITPEGRRKSAGYTWLASMAPRRSGCSTRTAPPSMPDRVICCLRGRESCWRSRSMPRGWRSTVKPFASLTTSPSIQGSASPRSPRQHPDRLRTARTASVERSSPGSIVLAGGSRPLVHRIKEAWPILRCRPTAVGSLSAASSVGIGTFG